MIVKSLNPIPKNKFWTLPSKLKGFTDDNFKYDENGKMIFNKVEKTVGKGEIARNKQFLLFPQCFQESCNADTGLVWEWAKYSGSLIVWSEVK